MMDIKMATTVELTKEAERLYDEFEKLKGEIHERYIRMQRISEEYQKVDAEIPILELNYMPNADTIILLTVLHQWERLLCQIFLQMICLKSTGRIFKFHTLRIIVLAK